jgi:hypothetical protein
MTLVPITNIEGLEQGFEDAAPLDDNAPGVNLIEFYVKSEQVLVKKLNKETGIEELEIEPRSFVRIRKIVNLGNSIIDRRIKDKVEFKDGKWVVKRLDVVSDIKRYTAEWNAFARGATQDHIGTPLVMLFKNDPARADYYKARYINTIEQLAQCGQSQTEQMGIGARDDVQKAIQFLERAKGSAGITAASLVEERDRQIKAQAEQIAELTARLTEVLTQDIQSAAPKAKKPAGKKRKEETPTDIEGLGA